MFKKIDEVLTETTEKLGIKAKLEEGKALLIWGESVGEEIAKNTQPQYIKQGILFVNTVSPVWAHQLTIIKSEILDKINRHLSVPVKDVRFKPKGMDNRPGQ